MVIAQEVEEGGGRERERKKGSLESHRGDMFLKEKWFLFMTSAQQQAATLNNRE